MAKRLTRKKVADGEVSTPAVRKVAPAPPLPLWLNQDWLWGLILVLAVILTYSPMWQAGFIWDDKPFIMINPCIVGPLGLKEIWTTSAADICPLVLTTFWIEHAAWGLAPLPYHLVNVFLHAACAILLWRVLRSLQAPGAWLGAALWALHPVQVETVAWVDEMKNTQSGLFYLLSILFFVRYLRAGYGHGQTSDGWNYALTLLFAALAMASKSSAVILPVVLCLCAWWLEGRWRWRCLVRIAPIFFMSIAACALAIWTQRQQLSVLPSEVRSWPERMATAGDAVEFYLGKLVWPHPLMAVYPRWQVDAGWWGSYLPLFAVLIVLFILWFKHESWSGSWFFVFAYFLAALLPVLGLVDLYFQHLSFVADRFQYLASMGPLALVGAGMARLSDLVIPGRPWLQSILVAAILLMLGLWSWQRAWIYESDETLWADTVARNPDCWAGYNNLGAVFSQNGRIDEAIIQYQKALAINPNYDEACKNLGYAFFQKGQVDEAMAQFQKTLAINPNIADVHNNLGGLLLQKGEVDEAIAHFQKALAIHPNYAKARNNLGYALLQKGQVDEAMAQFQKALEIDPQDASAHNNLGSALFQKGRMDEAMAQYQAALEINPNYTDAQNNLAKAQASVGQGAGQK